MRRAKGVPEFIHLFILFHRTQQAVISIVSSIVDQFAIACRLSVRLSVCDVGEL